MRKRNRFIYAGITICMMLLGLCTRRIAAFLPEALNFYAGDALWAMMIFFGFGFLLQRMRTAQLTFVSLLFCYLIEISQLYYAPWLDAIRHTTLGGLILGYGFLWSDMIAYSIGIGLATIAEIIDKRKKG